MESWDFRVRGMVQATLVAGQQQQHEQMFQPFLACHLLAWNSIHLWKQRFRCIERDFRNKKRWLPS